MKRDRCHWTFFPQVSKIREITARYGCWRERLVTSENTRNLRTSLTNRASRKSEDRRVSRAVWIHVTNPTLASLLLDRDSCAFIVEKDTNGRIAWGDIRESTVGTRRRNFPVIYATKSSSTDTNYGITSMLTTTYKSARCSVSLFAFESFPSSDLTSSQIYRACL